MNTRNTSAPCTSARSASIGGLAPSDVRTGSRVDHQPRLPRVGLRDRRRECDRRLERVDLAREARDQLLTGEQHDHRRRDDADPAARACIGQRLADAAERPPERQYSRTTISDDRRRRQHDQPERRRAHDHRGDVRHVAHIPVQVDVAAVQRRRGHVGVVADDEQHPDRGHPAQRRAGRRSEPAARGDHHQQDHGELDRQLAAPADRRCRPDVVEGQRRVEEHQRRDERSDRRKPDSGGPSTGPAHGLSATRRHSHRCRPGTSTRGSRARPPRTSC